MAYCNLNHQNIDLFNYHCLTTDDAFVLHWQMTNCERFALQDLLRRIQPDISIEVGTYLGGSLQVVSYFSRKVISIDIDPTVKERLFNRFYNVDFQVGISHQLLPDIISKYNVDDGDIEFVLIDGDHSAEGIRSDINALMSLKPRKRCVILMHDSFNPDCRHGIKTADWSSSQYTKLVELDFIPGIFHEVAVDTAEALTMWGGFACAVLTPEPRREPLFIQASQQGLFEAVYKISRYNKSPWNWRANLMKLNRYLGRWS